MRDGAGHELRAPDSPTDWDAYHDIRRTVLWERRRRFGVYDGSHPDETRPGNHPLLLFHDGQPLGVLRVDVTARCAILRRVAIDESRQRRGHGRAMLTLAEAFARAQGCDRIYSHVDADAVGFYERCGFSRDVMGAAASTVPMTKEL